MRTITQKSQGLGQPHLSAGLGVSNKGPPPTTVSGREMGPWVLLRPVPVGYNGLVQGGQA